VLKDSDGGSSKSTPTQAKRNEADEAGRHKLILLSLI